MTDQKPTGVFVRLPLSEDQAHVFLKESTAAWDECNGSSDSLACTSGLIAIGTPVTGGELEVAGWCHPQQLADLYIDNGSPEDERFVVMSRVQIGSRDIPLVRQSEAQDQIAARDAEIARLRERYEAIRWRFIQDAKAEGRPLTEYQFDSLVDGDNEAHRALKGGAA